MRKNLWLVRPLAVAVSSCFGLAPVWAANPTGPQVKSGTAQFQGLGTKDLKVTNSPNAIIHWQGFSIGAGSKTTFIQPSTSAVLNRVTGSDLSKIPTSQIDGLLKSDGRVFLINPAGIIIGATGVINTAGFVGSSLQMLDADFLAGKLKFQSDGSAGSITNYGAIKVGAGGNIVLVAPHIRNDGLIQTEGGELILAAGRKMTIGSLDLEGVQFEIQAPADSVLNVGQLLASGGAVGVFAGTLKHSGDIRAAALTRDEGGRIVLKGRGDVTIAAGSTIKSDGKSGGDILIQSETGKTSVAGHVSAPGYAGPGGDIKVLGERVSLVQNAYIDASGATGGGQIRVGGDYQGKNAAIQNASRTFVGPGAMLRADADDAGDGGRIIVWSDKVTQYYGNLSARGGPAGGNGGFAEVSGKEFLAFRGGADLGAPKGIGGDLLLDPLDLYVDDDGGFNIAIVNENTDFPGNAVTVTPTTLANLDANVTLFASRYMRINSNVTLGPGHGFTATVGTYEPLQHAADLPGFPDSAILEGTPVNRLDIAANITTNGGAVNLSAPRIESIRFGTPTPLAPRITTNGGAVNITSPGAIMGQTFFLDNMVIDAGAGAVSVTSTGANFQIGNVIGGTFTGTAPVNGFTTGTITTNGPVVLNSTRIDEDGNPAGSSIVTGAITSNGFNVTGNAFSFIQTGALQTAGGNVNLTSGVSQVITGAITSGAGAIDLQGGFSVSTGMITTTSASPVNLTATQGSINTQGVSAAGAINMTASAGAVTTNTIITAGAVNLTAGSGSISTTIDTPAAVNLDATQGNISATVNNAASLTANALRSNSNNNVSVTITSNAASGAPLNANEITAIHTFCSNVNNCGDANVTLNANGTGGVNLGTLTASAQPAAGNNSLGEQITVTASQGAIRALSPANKSTAANVTLRALVDGMGVGTSAAPINADVKRFLRFEARGNFGLALGTTGPNRLEATVGARGATGPDRSGTVTGGGIAMNVNSISDTAVSLQNLAITEVGTGGFKNVVNNGAPRIDFIVPTNNIGTLVNLIASNITVPEGGTVATGSAGLPVLVRASGNLEVTSYTRGGSGNPDSLGKSTQFTSDSGTMILGSIAGNKDSITATAPGNITISGTSLVTKGDVSVQSTGGNVTVGLIDTNGGAGNVSVTAAGDITLGLIDTKTGGGGTGTGTVTVSGQVILASVPGGAEEINAGGNISITGRLLGTSDAMLRVIGPKVTLTTTSAAGRIGAGSTPLLAETPQLTINTSAGQSDPFSVDTVSTALANLDVFTVPMGGTVTSQGTTYNFLDAGGNITFAPTIDAAHFIDGTLSLTTTSGNVTLDTIAMAPSASFAVHARGGSILGGESIDAKNITLTAASEGANPGAGPTASVEVGDIGGAVPFSNLTITAGYRNDSNGTSRSASVTTGALTAAPGGNVTVTTHGGTFMSIGGGTAPIGASGVANRAGNVTLRGERIGVGGDSTASILTGDIFANRIELRTGEVDGTAISVGALEAPTILIDRIDQASNNPSVAIDGAISAVRSLTANNFSSLNVDGGITGDASQANTISLVGGGITINGAISAPGAASAVTLNSSGSLILGPSGIADISAGSDSTIRLTQGLTAPFRFSTINASSTGTVIIAPGSNAIQQTGGTGITAANVTLGTAANILQTDGDGLLDLIGVKNLTLTASGNVALSNDTALENFTYTRGAAANFTYAGLGTQTIAIGNAATATLSAESTTPLNFMLTNNAPAGGINTTGTGIITNGGFVNLTAAGGIDATTGGINTTGTGDGSVSLLANGGSILTGAITTPDSAAISVTTNCVGCGIDVNGTLQNGVATGGFVGLQVLQSGNITQTGGSGIFSASGSVFVSTADGNIGADASNRIAINSPNVTLFAGTSSPLLTAPGPTEGNVFAALADTTSLNLQGANGFDVTLTGSPLDVLTLATRGSGTGSTLLTATGTGQTYTFSRTPTDLFPPNGAFVNTFQVVEATGTPALTTATFRALDGDLLVQGRASGSPITATNLTLDAQSATGDLKLQGNAANPLILNNPGAQTLSAGRHVEIGRKATISGGTQTISSTNGNVTFSGGTATDEAVLVSANVQQRIFTAQQTGGNVVFQAGSAPGTSVTASFNGAASGGVEQQIEARGEVQVRGGSDGTALNPAFARVTSNQDQLIRAGNRFGAPGTVLLLGGSGTGATAEITATGGGEQRVGESRFSIFCCDFDFMTLDVTLQAGSGAGASASIKNTGTGPQFVFSRFGTVSVLGGGGTDAFASIENTSAGGQQIGYPGFDSFGRRMNNLVLQGGEGTGAYALVQSLNGFQNINANSQITLSGIAGAGAGTNSSASIIGGAGQNIQGGNLTMNAGVANATDVRIQATGNQTISVANFILAAGGGPGTTASALISATATQSINASTLTMSGGPGANSISQILNTGDFQSVNTSTLNMSGGTGANSIAQISATGVQSVSGSTGIMRGGAGADSFARITTSAGPDTAIDNSEQSVSFFSSLTMTAAPLVGNSGAGSYVRIDSAGDQSLSGGNWALSGGNNTGAFAKIDAIAGSQSFFGNNLTLTAGGTADARQGNAGAVMEGLSQTVGASAIVLNGGAGTAGNVSDARLTDLAGNVACVFAPCDPMHSVSANSITLNGGAFHSTTGILNLGAGQQMVSGFNGVTLTGNAVGPGADVLINNPNATRQLITADGGGIRLDNTGTGLVSVASGGTQQTTSQFVDVVTSAGSSGNSALTSTGNQWIRTTDGTSAPTGGGSLRVAARGSGTASVDSGARQLLEIDYPGVMTAVTPPPGNLLVGAADAAGLSRIQAVDQLIFARTITVQGGSSTNAAAKLTGTNTQTISVLDGAINVLGGTGVGATAAIDPVTQTVVANNATGNAIAVSAGNAGAGANASIAATGAQTIVATRGNIALSGGAGSALIQTTNGPQVITAADAINLTGGGAPNGVAQITTPGAQTLSANIFNLTGGAGENAFARIHADGAQNITFDSLTMLGGTGADAFAKIDTLGTQTLTGVSGDIMLTASGNANVLIEGHAQTIACGAACDITLQGGSGSGSHVQILNLSGTQTINAGSVTLNAGAGTNARALITTPGAQVFNVGALNLAGGDGNDAFAQVHADGPQNLAFNALTMNAGNGTDAFARIDTAGTQTLTGGSGDISLMGSAGANVLIEGHSQTITCGPACDIMLQGGSSGGAHAQIVNLSGGQTINAGTVTLNAGAGANARALITSPGAQTLNAFALTVAGGDGSDAFAQIHADGAQSLAFSSLAMNAGNGPGAFAKIDTAGTQTLTGGTLSLAAGAGSDAFAQIHANGAQTLTFTSLTMNAGNGSGAFAKIDTAGTQTLTGGAGNITLAASPNASAILEGHSQTLTCGLACNLVLEGNAGAGAATAQIVNLSGPQTINAGSITLLGGPSSSTMGIFNQGTGDQIVTASAGDIFLASDTNATGSVLIQNVPASAQTITAEHDLILESLGAGTVAVTSGGTQNIDVRGLDVLTFGSGAGGADATVFAAGDQTIHTRGALGTAPGVGMRVASLSTGTAKVESAGNQVVNVEGNQLLIGRLLFGQTGVLPSGEPILAKPNDPSDDGNPAAGNSLVLATSATTNPNQTVTAGSVFIQGPTGDLKVSKLSGDGVQIVTATTGGITLVGGFGFQSFATIDPTNQRITAPDAILVQGGEGEDADAELLAQGPQRVESLRAPVFFRGGRGVGADARMKTSHFDQVVSGKGVGNPPGRGVDFQDGPEGGGRAGFERGSNLEAAQTASNNLTNNILSEQDRLDSVRTDAATREEEESRLQRRAQLCS